MKPRERIAAEYEQRPERYPFSYYVEWHRKNGVVAESPRFFVMGFPCHVASIATADATIDRMQLAVCRDDGPSCWYVSAIAGDMAKAWAAMPYRLPWIGWDRDDASEPTGKRLQIFPMASVVRLTLSPQEDTYHDLFTDRKPDLATSRAQV